MDSFGSNGHHGSIRLVRSDPRHCGSDPWGWFKIKVINEKKYVYAFESMRYPGLHLDAYDEDGEHAKLRLVKAGVNNIGGDPWGWFRFIKE